MYIVFDIYLHVMKLVARVTVKEDAYPLKNSFMMKKHTETSLNAH